MSLLEARNTFSVVVLSTLVSCESAFSQSPSEGDAGTERLRVELAPLVERSELVALHAEAIRQEESRNGPHSEALIGPLTALGMLYQEEDEHFLAIRALERALQIKRIENGLYSLDQVPITRALIVSERAIGDIDGVRQLEARIGKLVDRNPDDLRVVPILREAADRQFESYIRYLNGEYPPEFNINVDFDPGPDQQSTSNRSRASSRLHQARNDYMKAIRVMLDEGLYAHESLRDLEMRLIRSYYLEATSTNPTSFREESLYRLGKEAYRRLVVYGLKSGTTADVAKALVGLADWHLLFSHNATALEIYRQAYALLAGQEGTTISIDELFSPETPIVLPAFLPNPLASGTKRRSEGHIDVAFELSKYGRSRRIEILESSSVAAEDSGKELARLISRNRFRPIFEDARSPDTSRLRLRYYPRE